MHNSNKSVIVRVNFTRVTSLQDCHCFCRFRLAWIPPLSCLGLLLFDFQSPNSTRQVLKLGFNSVAPFFHFTQSFECGTESIIIIVPTPPLLLIRLPWLLLLEWRLALEDS